MSKMQKYVVVAVVNLVHVSVVEDRKISISQGSQFMLSEITTYPVYKRIKLYTV